MTITVYSFDDFDGEEASSFTTQNAHEAREYARVNRLRMVANEFEWTECYPVTGGDFTEAPLREEPE